MALSPEEIQELARSLPTKPGVYLMEDAKAKVIYVGKAKGLKKRVLSYFQESKQAPLKIQALVKRAAKVSFLVTGSEKEALILEATLIKRHRPRYNVMLRDDKAYPLIRLSTGHELPRLSIVRRMRKDGHRYFGPYVSAGAARTTMNLMNRIFPLRKCKGSKPPPRSRPCLNHQLGLCLGPCCLDIPAEVYQSWVDQAALFLSGRVREVVGRLEEAMRQAAAEERFEEAAALRDRIKAVEATLEKQVMVSDLLLDQDVFGFAPAPTGLAVAVLFIRQGALVGSRNFLLKGVDRAEPQIIGQSLGQFYTGKSLLPDRILLPASPEDVELLAEWLSEVKGSRVTIMVPKRGQARELVARAQANAESAVPVLAGSPESLADQGLEELGRKLDLPAAPDSLECYDISIHAGQLAFGAMVRFEGGRPVRSKYRNYKIRTAAGRDEADPAELARDDTAMLAEVLKRRFSKMKPGLGPPDLVVIDGGKGQLNAARAALAEAGLAEQKVVALAKTPEAKDADRLFIPGRKNPLPLSRASTFLLMRLRDEAHRRAISAHRQAKSRKVSHTALLGIPGVGPKKAQALLKSLGSVKAVSQASAAELEKAPGVSAVLAARIRDYFQGRDKVG